jgi:regulator of protease activity HflC (stomatin/prohibitin superfamily)
MKNKLIFFGIIAIVVSVIVIVVANSTFLTIDAGFRGVLFRPFAGGIDKKNIYGPGFHMIAPWNKMFTYDVRESQLEESMSVLSSNGLNIKLDVTVRVNPIATKIGDLHDHFGVNYMANLVRPEVRAAVRKIIGRFQPEELYSTKRDEVQALITKDLEKVLGANYIELRAILIRDILLPEKVRMAIEEKIEAEQKSLKYEFILTMEHKEKERLLIEASAKSEANTILSASLSDKILADKGIEATLKLANSPNSKIVIIGNDKNGLPLILGNQQ